MYVREAQCNVSTFAGRNILSMIERIELLGAIDVCLALSPASTSCTQRSCHELALLLEAYLPTEKGKATY